MFIRKRDREIISFLIVPTVIVLLIITITVSTGIGENDNDVSGTLTTILGIFVASVISIVLTCKLSDWGLTKLMKKYYPIDELIDSWIGFGHSQSSNITPEEFSHAILHSRTYNNLYDIIYVLNARSIIGDKDILLEFNIDSNTGLEQYRNIYMFMEIFIKYHDLKETRNCSLVQIQLNDRNISKKRLAYLLTKLKIYEFHSLISNCAPVSQEFNNKINAQKNELEEMRKKIPQLSVFEKDETFKNCAVDKLLNVNKLPRGVNYIIEDISGNDYSIKFDDFDTFVSGMRELEKQIDECVVYDNLNKIENVFENNVEENKDIISKVIQALEHVPKETIRDVIRDAFKDTEYRQNFIRKLLLTKKPTEKQVFRPKKIYTIPPHHLPNMVN